MGRCPHRRPSLHPLAKGPLHVSVKSRSAATCVMVRSPTLQKHCLRFASAVNAPCALLFFLRLPSVTPARILAPVWLSTEAGDLPTRNPPICRAYGGVARSNLVGSLRSRPGGRRRSFYTHRTWVVMACTRRAPVPRHPGTTAPSIADFVHRPRLADGRDRRAAAPRGPVLSVSIAAVRCENLVLGAVTYG